MAINEFSFSWNGKNKVYFGTAVPTAGEYYNIGDILLVTPVSGSPAIYACTAASSSNNGGTWVPMLPLAKKQIYYGTAVPQSGNQYKQGDWLWKTDPEASGPFLYVCVADAANDNGGTWVSAGNLAAS